MYIYTHYTPYRNNLQVVLKKEQNVYNIFTFMGKFFLNIKTRVAQNMIVTNNTA